MIHGGNEGPMLTPLGPFGDPLAQYGDFLFLEWWTVLRFRHDVVWICGGNAGDHFRGVGLAWNNDEFS